MVHGQISEAFRNPTLNIACQFRPIYFLTKLRTHEISALSFLFFFFFFTETIIKAEILLITKKCLNGYIFPILMLITSTVYNQCFFFFLCLLTNYTGKVSMEVKVDILQFSCLFIFLNKWFGFHGV